MVVSVEPYIPWSVAPSLIFVFIFALADPPRPSSLFSPQPVEVASLAAPGLECSVRGSTTRLSSFSVLLVPHWGRQLH
jgi:hypothetical protein